jgi:hypothetical protein
MKYNTGVTNNKKVELLHKWNMMKGKTKNENKMCEVHKKKEN